ncbi:MAG: hypothetical protein J6C44_03010 [Muribaculaceae bacterium]|nr:hypothetical protein [Muribaculaceae bacterium]
MKKTHTLFIPAIFITLTILPVACNPSSNDGTESNTPAKDLSTAIDIAIQEAQYDRALSLIDSLNKTFPDSLEYRRATIAQRAKAVEGLTISAIPESDMAMAMAQKDVDSLSHEFSTVSVSSAVSPYLVYTPIKGQHPVVEARVGDEDMPWMIIINNGDGQHLAIALIDHSGNTVATSTASALPIISTEEADPIGQAIASYGNYDGWKLKIGNSTHSLTTAQAHAIASSWRLAKAKKALRQALIDREGLERRLMAARNQVTK